MPTVLNTYDLIITLPYVLFFFNLRAMQKAAETAASEMLAGETGGSAELTAADAASRIEPPSAV